MRSWFATIARVAPLAWAAFASAAAHGAAVQVLDSVDVFGRDSTTSSSTVLEMAFRDPFPRPAPFDQLGVAGTAILACQRAADQGLYCLDGSLVRYFPDTKAVPYGSPLPDIELLDCRDPALKLDTKRPNPCTSLTVDLNGGLWLAGRKANSHSLLKVVRESTLNASNVTCTPAAGTGPWYRLSTPSQDPPHIPAGTSQSVPGYCAREYAPGRPILVDTNMIDGELSNGFAGTPGVLGLEERKTVVFFLDATTTPLNSYTGTPLPPIEFASGKTGWNLIGNEQILSATLLQYGTAEPKQNYVLVTTTAGRIMAKKAAIDPATNLATGVGTGTAFPVFALQPGECAGTGEQTYEVRVSSQSERVYVADRFCKRVLALKWITGPSADYPAYPSYCARVDSTRPNDFCLVNAKEGPTSGPLADVTLSTASTSPDGLSVAPGIGIDLRDCGFNADGSPKSCPWVADGTDGNTFNAAEASGVRIESNGKSKMTVFQVRGIPDDRCWEPGATCPSPGGYLDLTPLLPIEVTSQFESAMLPPLLISPRYRGQLNKDGKRTIDLFFAIPEPGVQFRDTFRMSFDVGDLTDGVKWGCGGRTATRPDLEWNVVVTGSEKYMVVDGPNLGYVETLVNDGCSNPDGVTSKRFSYYAYNLEVVPNGDGVYATMVRAQFDDILSTQRKTACASTPVFDPYTPPQGGVVQPPLASATCGNLETKWSAADEKLQRCITGSTYPRQSEAVNNCQSFLSQLGQYESALNAAPRLGQDPANRIGELKARAKVLRYVFEQHFVPSIPPNGFCSLTATGTCTP